MKKLFLAMVVLVSTSAHALTMEKDRGGEVVPFAKGAVTVMLSRTYSESLVTIEGEAAELMFKALTVEAKENSDVFRRKGEEVVKQKNNVKCLTGDTEPRTYKCLIRVQN